MQNTPKGHFCEVWGVLRMEGGAHVFQVKFGPSGGVRWRQGPGPSPLRAP